MLEGDVEITKSTLLRSRHLSSRASLDTHDSRQARVSDAMASISDSFGSVGFAWQRTWPHGDHDRQPRRVRSSNISRVAPDCSCPKPGEPSSESSEFRLLSRKAIRGQTDRHGTRQCFERLDMIPEARLLEVSSCETQLQFLLVHAIADKCDQAGAGSHRSVHCAPWHRQRDPALPWGCNTDTRDVNAALGPPGT